MKVIESDIRYLEKQKIIDYSLLIGVHRKEEALKKLEILESKNQNSTNQGTLMGLTSPKSLYLIKLVQ